MLKFDVFDNELDRLHSSFAVIVEAVLMGQERLSDANRDLLIKLLDQNCESKFNIYGMLAAEYCCVYEEDEEEEEDEEDEEEEEEEEDEEEDEEHECPTCSCTPEVETEADSASDKV